MRIREDCWLFLLRLKNPINQVLSRRYRMITFQRVRLFLLLLACSCASKQNPSSYSSTNPISETNHTYIRETVQINRKSHLREIVDERGLPMPTLLLSPGDTLDLALSNALDGVGANAMNLHFHGLQISPKAPADDVLDTYVLPGQSIHYHFVIPKDHPPGLYWYHPHIHGRAYEDLTAGISGVIIIDGLQKHYPAIMSLPSQTIILRNIRSKAGPAEEESHLSNSCRPESGFINTVNGELDPSFSLRTGAQSLFRVVNAAAGRFYDVFIGGSRLRLLALDGVPIDTYPGSNPPPLVDSIEIPPGGRAEFLATGPNRSSALLSQCVNSGPAGDPEPITRLERITVEGRSGRESGYPYATDPPTVRSVNSDYGFFSKRLGRVATRRFIRLSERGKAFYVDGQTYSNSSRPLFSVKIGTVELWNVKNDSDEIHAFHIHQVHFLADYLGSKVWLDTIAIPPHKAKWLAVDFRNPIARGTILLHCHILDHEDGGMMAKIIAS